MQRLMKNVKEGDRIRFLTADDRWHYITVDAVSVPTVYVLPVGYTNPQTDHFEFDGNLDMVEVEEEQVDIEALIVHLRFFEERGMIDYWEHDEQGFTIVADWYKGYDLSLNEARIWTSGAGSALAWKDHAHV